MYNGAKNTRYGEDDPGLEYKHMLGSTWDTTALLSFLIPDKDTGNIPFTLHSSDGGTTYTLPFKRVDTSGLEFYEDGKVSSINTDSSLYKKLENTVRSEFEEYKIMFNELFNLIDGKLYVKQKYNTKRQIDGTEDPNKVIGLKPGDYYKIDHLGNFVKTDRPEEVKAPDLAKLHNVKHFDGNKLLDKNNNPTGRLFKDFYNMSIRDGENNIYFREYLDKEGINMNHISTDDFSKVLDSVLPAFINKFVKTNTDAIIKDLGKLYPNIEKTIDYNAKNDGRIINNIKDYNEKLLVPFILNRYLFDTDVNLLINGQLNQYKNTDDWNKRVGQSMKRGLKDFSTRTYIDETGKKLKFPKHIMW
jgi:hypothetical protein